MYVCSRNCIIIIINFFLNIWRDVVYFVYYYNCVRCCFGDVSKLPGDCNFFGLLFVHWGQPQISQLLGFLQRLEEDGCGMRWRVIVISLLKMYVKGWRAKSRWGTSVDAHEDRYFVWWGGSSGGGSDGIVSGGGDGFCLLLLLKSRSARRASLHSAFMATARLLVTHF